MVSPRFLSGFSPLVTLIRSRRHTSTHASIVGPFTVAEKGQRTEERRQNGDAKGSQGPCHVPRMSTGPCMQDNNGRAGVTGLSFHLRTTIPKQRASMFLFAETKRSKEFRFSQILSGRFGAMPAGLGNQDQERRYLTSVIFFSRKFQVVFGSNSTKVA